MDAQNIALDYSSEWQLTEYFVYHLEAAGG